MSYNQNHHNNQNINNNSNSFLGNSNTNQGQNKKIVHNEELSIDYIFNLKNDINSIIASSDELKKSEAIAEGLSLLSQRIILLEKIKEKQITDFQNLKFENLDLHKSFEQYRKDYFVLKDKLEFTSKENSELKLFISKNQEKIIKYDNLFLELKSTGNINENLKSKIEKLNEEHVINYSKLKNDYDIEINEIKQQQSDVINQLKEYEGIIDQKNKEINNLKNIIKSINSLNKKSYIGTSIKPLSKSKSNSSNNFISKSNNKSSHKINNTSSDIRINREMINTVSTLTHNNNTTNNISYDDVSNTSNNYKYQNKEIKDWNFKTYKNDDNNSMKKHSERSKNNEEENFTLRPNSIQTHNNNNNLEFIKKNYNTTTEENTNSTKITNINNNYHQTHYQNDNSEIPKSHSVNIHEDKFVGEILNYNYNNDASQLNESRSNYNTYNNNTNISADTKTSKNSINMKMELENSIEETANLIKDSEKKLYELNKEFAGLDKGDYSRVSSLMELIENESNRIIELKCEFNHLYKQVAN